MKRKMTKIILIIAILLLILIAFLIWWLPSFVMTGRRQTLEEAFTWQSERYNTDFYANLTKESYTITGSEGYILHAEYLNNPEKTTKYIIITHGYTDNRFGALKYVPMYLELGFNCIIYDLRGHGLNEPTFTTYGIREGDDLKYVIEETKKRYPVMTMLGLHGE